MNRTPKELVNLFLDLVKIDSPSGQEKEVGLWVKRYLNNLGLITKIDREGNLMSGIKGRGEPILFCAHLDTVEPGRKIRPVIKGGWIRSGRDTILGADNKAPLACILLALKSLISQKAIHRSIDLVFSVKEETDGGIKFVDIKKLSAKTGFIFDCMEKDLGKVIMASPFISDFKVSINGRGSHASQPEKGVDAIKIVSEIIRQHPPGRLDQDSTFNIGLIEGGTATNAVPSKVKLKGDIRSFGQRKFKEYKQNFEKIGREATKKMGGKFIVSWQPYCQGYCHDSKSEPMLKLKTIYQNFGFNLKPTKSTAGSDANFLNSRGIRTFVLGDGVEAAHTLRERISLVNLNRLYRVIYTLMAKW